MGSILGVPNTPLLLVRQGALALKCDFSVTDDSVKKLYTDSGLKLNPYYNIQIT